MLKRISLYGMAALYLGAGVNHFRVPEFYMRIIPPYIGHAATINVIAGIAEIIVGLLLLFPATRRAAGYATVVMLIAFIPAHIYMIEANCTATFCSPPWVLWVRLVLVQPLLIAWALWVSKR